MEVSTNNNSTQQQQILLTNNSKNNDISTSINTGQQQHSLTIGNDNLQSQTTKSSSIILTELTPTTTTATITETKTHTTTGSSLTESTNNRLNSNSDQAANNIDSNGDTVIVSHQNKHDQPESNGELVEAKEMNNESTAEDDQSVIESILFRVVEDVSAKEDQIKSQPNDSSINNTNDTANVSQSSLCIPAGNGLQTKMSLITPVAADEVDDDKTKDIVTLRNLEITPPPPQPADISSEIEETGEDPDASKQTKSRRETKRPHPGDNKPSDDPSNSRAKRQRKQTELFQVEAKPSRLSTSSEKSIGNSKRRTSSSSSGRSSTAQSKQKQPKQAKRKHSITQPEDPHHEQAQQQQLQINLDSQHVILYDKNDYLAIRNEENSFYLCQLSENVRVEKPFIKVKWLDTRDDGRTYFLTSQFDKVPQKSIITPVILNKLRSEKKGEQLFSLDDQAKDQIMDRLRRSLNVPAESEQ